MMTQQEKNNLIQYGDLEGPVKIKAQSATTFKRVKWARFPKQRLKVCKLPKEMAGQCRKSKNLLIVQPQSMNEISLLLTKRTMRRWISHSFRRPQPRCQQHQSQQHKLRAIIFISQTKAFRH